MTKYDSEWYKQYYGNYFKAFATIMMIAANVLVFVCQNIMGRELSNKGALIFDKVIEGEYYRIFSSMFLHADSNHLFSNMIGLLLFGVLVENSIGHFWYLLIAVLSGVAGNVLSLYIENLRGEYYYSVGASGIVFGIVGSLLILTLFYRKKDKSIIRRMLIAVMFMVYMSITNKSVNNEAHIGGFICGIILTLITILLRKKKIKLQDF